MTRRVSRLARAGALAAVAGALVGTAACAAGGSAGPVSVSVEAPEWVADAASGWDAAADPCLAFVTGRAPADRNASRAEDAARDAALGVVAAFAEATIARLDAAFRARAASVLEPEALAAALSDSGMRWQLVDAARGAARVQGKWSSDDSFHVWMRFDADAGLLAGYEKALAQRLALQSRELTPADHTQLRQALEQAVAERNAGP